MSESYLVLFNSQGANVINNSSVNNVSYNVNWGAFLPKNHKRFTCQMVFKGVNNGSAMTDNCLINMNIGRTNIFDGNSMTQNVGFIYPVALNSSNYFYSSTNNDNNDFVVNYPSSNVITVNIKTFSGGNPTTMPHYCLYLRLQPIDEQEN
jgi:hypothetical protein